MTSPPSGYPFGLEAQVAVLASEVKTLRRDIQELRAELREYNHAAVGAGQARSIAVEVFREETADDTSSRDNVMRLVTFIVSIGTAYFVIRGGK